MLGDSLDDVSEVVSKAFDQALFRSPVSRVTVTSTSPARKPENHVVKHARDLIDPVEPVLKSFLRVSGVRAVCSCIVGLVYMVSSFLRSFSRPQPACTVPNRLFRLSSITAKPADPRTWRGRDAPEERAIELCRVLSSRGCLDGGRDTEELATLMVEAAASFSIHTPVSDQLDVVNAGC